MVDPTIWDTIKGLIDTEILAEFLKVVPIAVPVVISFLAFRKGYGFLKRQLKGA